VEGRGVSQEATSGARDGDAKERSKTEGRVSVSKGNLVYTPGVFKREKGSSEAVSKYVEEVLNSLSDRARSGSARGWWILKSPRIS
jgi:hypothetical protein